MLGRGAERPTCLADRRRHPSAPAVRTRSGRPHTATGTVSSQTYSSRIGELCTSRYRSEPPVGRGDGSVTVWGTAPPTRNTCSRLTPSGLRRSASRVRATGIGSFTSRSVGTPCGEHGDGARIAEVSAGKREVEAARLRIRRALSECARPSAMSGWPGRRAREAAEMTRPPVGTLAPQFGTGPSRAVTAFCPVDYRYFPRPTPAVRGVGHGWIRPRGPYSRAGAYGDAVSHRRRFRAGAGAATGDPPPPTHRHPLDHRHGPGGPSPMRTPNSPPSTNRSRPPPRMSPPTHRSPRPPLRRRHRLRWPATTCSRCCRSSPSA